MSEEIWKPIPKWEDLYLVSNLGRVQTIASGQGRRPGHTLKHGINKNTGYAVVSLYRNSIGSTKTIHRLEAKAFLGLTDDSGLEVNHIDGNRQNNTLTNLEIVTPGENIAHSYKILNRPKVSKPGESNGNSKLTPEEVREIRRIVDSGMTRTMAAYLMGVTVTTVCNIINGKIWTSVE